MIHFVDAKKRKWCPRVTGRVLVEFEKLSGIAMFEAIFDLLMSKKDDEASNAEILGLIKKLFGSLHGLMRLLYESCRTGPKRVVIGPRGQEVEFDDFCEAIDESCITEAMKAATEALLKFFPEPKGEDEAPFEESQGPGPGKTSTR